MYGRTKFCLQQILANDDFLKSSDSLFHKDRRKASEAYSNRGWDYLRVSDTSTAMKRFNQSWLLDSTYYGAYWGFAAVLGTRKQFQESLQYFTKAIALNPKNSNLMLDAASSYFSLFFQTQEKQALYKCIENLKQAINIDQNNKLAYSKLTIAYFNIDYSGNDSAKKYLRIADSLDSKLIEPDLRKVILGTK